MHPTPLFFIYIRPTTRCGEWERLPQTAPKITTVVLDKSRLTLAEYLSLDRTTRAQLSAQWGPDAIGKVMARK